MKSIAAPSVHLSAGPFLVLVAGAWLLWPYLVWVLGAVTILTLLGLVVAKRRGEIRLMAILRGMRWRRAIQQSWPSVSAACGLGVHGVPGIRRCRAQYPYVRLHVRAGVGQTTGDYEAAAEAVRSAMGVSRVRVEAHGNRDVLLTFTIADALVAPFEAQPAESVDTLDSVEIGLREDGQAWRLALGPHTLVVGSSGAGKGSVFWSLILGLAPAVADGRVQVHGIDLKGGMEVLMGRELFTSCATTAEEAVALLELLVTQMRARTSAYAGVVRQHAASAAEPFHLIMIDELAALTAYCSERDLQRRAEVAISLLCSQGRAPGFMVFACLQDPRKEVIPTRGLFTQMVGLRLKDASETSMVLGESAILSGAHCHRILRAAPGTAYVVPEEGGHPIRVRAGFASDAKIQEVAASHSAPVRVSVPDLERESTDRPRARARATGGAS